MLLGHWGLYRSVTSCGSCMTVTEVISYLAYLGSWGNNRITAVSQAYHCNVGSWQVPSLYQGCLCIPARVPGMPAASLGWLTQGGSKNPLTSWQQGCRQQSYAEVFLSAKRALNQELCPCFLSPSLQLYMPCSRAVCMSQSNTAERFSKCHQASIFTCLHHGLW